MQLAGIVPYLVGPDVLVLALVAGYLGFFGLAGLCCHEDFARSVPSAPVHRRFCHNALRGRAPPM